MKYLTVLLSLTLFACSGPAPISPEKPQTQTEPVTPFASQFYVSTLAGNGKWGYAEGADAQFYHPSSVVLAEQGGVYVLDRFNHRIREVKANGMVSTLWGDGERGFKDGPQGTGRLNQPITLLNQANEGLLILDAQNHAIRRLKNGELTTLSGGAEGYRDGELKQSRFNWPSDIVADSDGSLYVSDRFNHCIRKITPAGIVSTLAGNGEKGFENGIGKAARFDEPMGLAMGPDRHLYVSDSRNSVIRKVSLSGEVTSFAGSGLAGSREDSLLKAEFRDPTGLAFDKEGALYVADRFNHRIRVIRNGQVSSLAGNGQPGYQNGKGDQVSFSYPYDLVIDAAGDIYVSDYGNHAIRKLTAKMPLPNLDKLQLGK